MKKQINKFFDILRKIIWWFFIFVWIIGIFIVQEDLWFWFFMIFIWILIYPNFIDKILNLFSKKQKNISNKIIKTKSNQKSFIQNVITKIKEEYKNLKANYELKKQDKIENNSDVDIKIDSEFISNYSSFICEDWEEFHLEREDNSQGWRFWEDVLEAYKEITIEFENVKLNEDIEIMKNFENSVHIFFKERVLQKALENWFIDSLEPNKIRMDNWEQARSYFEFLWRVLTKAEMQEAKKIYEKEKRWFKEIMNKKIYDLYSKTLRRVWNYYKKYKNWELALDIFLKIDNFWFKWIRDWQSIIKCQKEIELKNQKLIK